MPFCLSYYSLFIDQYSRNKQQPFHSPNGQILPKLNCQSTYRLFNGLKKIVKITNCAFLFPKMQLFNLSLNFANVKGLLKDYKIVIFN